MPDEPRPLTDQAQRLLRDTPCDETGPIANGVQARAFIADRVRRVDIGFLSEDQIQVVAQEIIDHLVPPIRRQTAEDIARAIETDLQGEFPCAWTRTEAAAIARDHGEAD